MRLTALITADDPKLNHNDFEAAATAIPRSYLEQEDLVPFPIPLIDWYVHDSRERLPATAAADDLAFKIGTFATSPDSIESSDAAGTTITQYALARWIVPEGFVTGQTLQFVANFKMQTVSDGTATLDIQVFENTKVGGIGSDLYAGAAVDVNDSAATDYSFAITSTGLSAGDELIIRMALAVTDSLTGSGVIGQFNYTELQADIKG